GVEWLRFECVVWLDRGGHQGGDRQGRTQLARAPMCRSVGRLALERPIQDPRLQPRGQLARALPGMATEQPGQPLLPKPLAPAGDKRIITAQLDPDLCPGMACRQQQDQPRARPIIHLTAPARGPLAQFHTFASVSSIVLFMSTIMLPFYALQSTSLTIFHERL